MTVTLKNRLGLLYPIVIAFGASLLILTAARIALSLWLFERTNEQHAWATIFLSGLRIDFATTCYLLLLPALLSCLLAGNGRLAGYWSQLLRIWLVLGIWFLVFMELATPSFILEYDVRPNRLFVEYLLYPAEVSSMLWTSHRLELLIGVAASLGTMYWAWNLTRNSVRELTLPRWHWRPVLAIVVILVGVMGARSTLGHRPLNPALVAFSSDPLMNDLVLNSAYSVLFAVSQMNSEDSAFKHYGKMDSHEIIDLVRQSSGRNLEDFNSNTLPTLAYHPASYQGKPKNLVILLQESLGAQYVGALGGLPLTPNLDVLMQEGWNFTQMYCTGTRSVRGIEAVLAGFPPTPGSSVVKLGKSQKDFFTIAELLKNQGYHTQFIYGGESHFDNMKSFFLGNGFVDIQDFPTFNSPKFVASWGASDEDLYDKAHQQFELLQAQHKPFFSFVFTSSNHDPFEYPDGRIEPYNEPKQTRENAAKYADYALGEFFKKAKASSYWDDTIFIVVADHDSRANGSQLVPIKHFHIPAVIVGKDIPARQDERLASQIDLPPTLLSLIGISSENPMIGFDLTQALEPSKQRAMMQFHKNYAWMTHDRDVVILQSEQVPLGFSYDQVSQSLSPKALPASLMTTAKANALWASLAYQENFYRSVTP